MSERIISPLREQTLREFLLGSIAALYKSSIELDL
jgi:hypothetical protein